MNRPDAIPEAFAGGKFVEGQRLWEEYATGLQVAIAAGSASCDMLAEAREILEQSRLAVKVFRAHAADQLDRAHAALAYQAPAPSLPRLVRTSV